MNRHEMMTLTPSRYLAQGYRDEQGLPRAELTGEWAAAAAQQLRSQGISAARLEPVVAKVTLQGEDTPSGIGADLSFVRACKDQVRSSADLPVFAQHLGAVLRLLALAESTAGFNQPQGAMPPRK